MYGQRAGADDDDDADDADGDDDDDDDDGECGWYYDDTGADADDDDDASYLHCDTGGESSIHYLRLILQWHVY